MRVTFVSSFPPRKCGLASYTASLVRALASIEALRTDVVAVEAADDSPGGHSNVLRSELRDDYSSVAKRLNATADVVCIQHEYGIFGGDHGRYVLDLVENMRIPLVLVPHSILGRPNATQRAVLTALCRASSRVVAPTHQAQIFLRDRYDVPSEAIDVIPHGVPLRETSARLETSDSRGEIVLGSYGLLSPGKGFEIVIRALALIRNVRPNVRAVFVGATHPSVRRHEGEGYRTYLIGEAERHGVASSVSFVNRYVGDDEVVSLVDAFDVFIAPYIAFEQIVSGTIAMAIGRGRPVVAADSWFAREALAGGRGSIFSPGDEHALARAVLALLADDEWRTSGRDALKWAHERGMGWAEVARSYAASFARSARAVAEF